MRARVELRQAVAGKVIDGNYVWIAMQMPHAWIVKIRHVKEMGDRHFHTAEALQRQPEIVFRIEVRKR